MIAIKAATALALLLGSPQVHSGVVGPGVQRAVERHGSAFVQVAFKAPQWNAPPACLKEHGATRRMARHRGSVLVRKPASGILARNPSGMLCHAMIPQMTFSNYPNPHEVDPGPGEAYQAYVAGPGVTPLVMTCLKGH